MGRTPRPAGGVLYHAGGMADDVFIWQDGLLTECGAGRRSAWLVLVFGGGTSLLRCRPSNIVAGKLVAPRVSARGA